MNLLPTTIQRNTKVKIGLTYNLRDEVSPFSIANSEFNEEFDSSKTIDAFPASLKNTVLKQ